MIYITDWETMTCYYDLLKSVTIYGCRLNEKINNLVEHNFRRHRMCRNSNFGIYRQFDLCGIANWFNDNVIDKQMVLKHMSDFKNRNRMMICIVTLLDQMDQEVKKIRTVGHLTEFRETFIYFSEWQYQCDKKKMCQNCKLILDRRRRFFYTDNWCKHVSWFNFCFVIAFC